MDHKLYSLNRQLDLLCTRVDRIGPGFVNPAHRNPEYPSPSAAGRTGRIRERTTGLTPEGARLALLVLPEISRLRLRQLCTSGR